MPAAAISAIGEASACVPRVLASPACRLSCARRSAMRFSTSKISWSGGIIARFYCGRCGARRAAIRLAWLLGAVLVAAVLIVTTWMGLVAAGVVFMLGQGASWVVAILVAALLNVVGAAALGWWMLALIKELPFTALLRQLRGDAPQKPQ